MKLITLNTHSLAEPDYERKLAIFARLVKEEQPDIIALQEVNQTMSRPAAMAVEELGYVPCQDNGIPVREDNHALALARLLKESGCGYYWTWASAKVGYEIYEEGLAVFSRGSIEATRQFFISKSHDFYNWKTRKMVGAKVGGMWFYSVHMGWWEDDEEPFSRHWDTAVKEIGASVCGDSSGDSPVWVMGDFNSPAGIPDGGWAYVKASGWKDTYDLAREKDDGITVGKVIDGWRERLAEAEGSGEGGRTDEGHESPGSAGENGPAGSRETSKSEEDCVDREGNGTAGNREASRSEGDSVDGEGSGPAGKERTPGMRIDYIWCSQNVDVDISEVICNGINYEVVSDHYGVMITEKGR